MSKARAAANAEMLKAIKKSIITVVPKGMEQGVALVRVHPDDLPLMRKIIDPGLVGWGWALASTAVLAEATGMTAVQGLSIAGSVVTKGPKAGLEVLMDKVLPRSPVGALGLAKMVKKVAELNFKLSRDLLGGGKGGGNGGRDAGGRDNDGDGDGGADGGGDRG